LCSKQYKKALYILDFNSKLYPYKANVFDSLGEAFYVTENYTEALKNYGKVLAIEPQNKNALEMIEKINSNLNK